MYKCNVVYKCNAMYEYSDTKKNVIKIKSGYKPEYGIYFKTRINS